MAAQLARTGDYRVQTAAGGSARYAKEKTLCVNVQRLFKVTKQWWFAWHVAKYLEDRSNSVNCQDICCTEGLSVCVSWCNTSSFIRLLVCPRRLGQHFVPGGGGGLGGLPLDFRRLSTDLLPQGRLHLSGDVWGRLADLHGRLQVLNRVLPVHLHLQRLLLFHLCHFALGDRRGSGRGRLEETHVEAIFGVGRKRLAPPNRPAQLPKDKERDYQQGEATETHDHSKETDRDVCFNPQKKTGGNETSQMRDKRQTCKEGGENRRESCKNIKS